MNSYRIIFTPRASEDLRAIDQRISHDSPQGASSMITAIFDAIELLAELPHRTVVARQNAKLRHPVRSLPVPPYMVYFRALDEERVVRILHIRHGARRQPRKFE